MKGCGRVAIAMSALVALSGSSAFGQPTQGDAVLATQLFDDAQRLMAEGNAVAACPKYAESQRRDPQLGTLLHLADCNEKVGKLASAWAGYKAAAEIAARRNAGGGNEPREQVARARAAALERKLSTVVIHVADANVAGLEIRRDGEPLGRAVWGTAMPVDPGRYTFAAEAPGKKIWTKTVDVREGGGKIDVAVPALEDIGASTSAANRPDPGATQRGAGYLLTGLGVVGIGVGTVFGLNFLSQRDRYNESCATNGVCSSPEEKQQADQLESDARSSRTAAAVAFAIGGAAAVAGITLVLTAPSSISPGVNGLKVVPWGGFNSAGASLSGQW